jgi:hypothetical protein
MVKNPIEIEVQTRYQSISIEIGEICLYQVFALYFEIDLDSYLQLQLLLKDHHYNKWILEILQHKRSSK